METCPVNHESGPPSRRDFDVLPDATLEFEKEVKTGEYICIYANQAAHDLFGYPAGELLGIDLRDLIPPSLRKKHSSLVDGFRNGSVKSRSMGEAGRLQKAVREDGSEFDCSISIYQYAGPEGKDIVGAIVKPEGKAAAIIKEQNEKLKEQIKKTSEAYEELKESSLATKLLDGNNDIIKWLMIFVAYGLSMIFIISWKIPESLQVIPHVREIITVTISFVGGYLAKGASDLKPGKDNERGRS